MSVVVQTGFKQQEGHLRRVPEHDGKEMAPQLSVVVRGKRVACLPRAHLLLGAVPIAQKDGLEIRLPDERHVEALQAVVGYLADGTMDGVDAHNATEVLECARLLGLGNVRDACEEALAERVAAENCVRLRQLASQCGLPRLKRVCDSFLTDSFAGVLAERAGLDLPRVQVRLDVSSQTLELGTDLLEKFVPRVLVALDTIRRSTRKRLEEAVVQLVLQPDLRVTEWCREPSDKLRQHAPLSPERNSAEFYAKLRGGCSPARQLILTPTKTPGNTTESCGMRLLATAKLTDASSACLVEEGASLIVVSISVCTLLHNGQLPTSPTTGLPTFSQTNGCFISHMSLARSGFGIVATESEILAVGGFNRSGCLDSTESYSSITNSWKSRERMNVARGRLCTAVVEDRVYAIGGSDGKRELSTVEVQDLKHSRQWQKLKAGMPTPRSCHAAAVLDGVVYVVGGEHYSVPLKTSESFNPSTGSWRTLSPTTTAHSDLALATCSGKVYAIGGNAPGLKCLSSVEAYDPARNLWSPVASMQFPRRNAAVVTVGDKIMVIGGYSGTEVLRSVEIYDPATNEWRECPPLCGARSHSSAVLYNKQVYVFGGYSGSLFLNTAECFDLRTEQWTPFA